MKTFKVLVKAYRVVLVQVEDDETGEDAEQKASEDLIEFDWEIDEYQAEEELTTPGRIEQAKKHGAEMLEDC